MKVRRLNESDIQRIVKRVLNEQESTDGNRQRFLQNVINTIDKSSAFKQMINDYGVDGSIEQKYIIGKIIEPNEKDSENYQDYRIEDDHDHYIVYDKYDKELYTEKKQ